MVTHIAVCGDSFGVGAGLPDETCFEDSFGGVVASHFKLPQKVYARSGCCNFTIYLQVKKIIEQMTKNTNFKPFVLITTTFHERFIFPLDDGFNYKRPDLRDVEYLSYTPYWSTGSDRRDLAFDVSKHSRLITETISNIQHFQAGNAPGIAQLFEKVNKKKFEAIKHYYMELFDTGIKQEQDEALFVTMHTMLKKHNIPHLLMGHRLSYCIDDANKIELGWGEYTSKYPDPRGSGHCDKTGNRLVGEKIIEHIKEHRLI